jgi:hypothetical protein
MSLHLRSSVVEPQFAQIRITSPGADGWRRTDGAAGGGAEIEADGACRGSIGGG